MDGIITKKVQEKSTFAFLPDGLCTLGQDVPAAGMFKAGYIVRRDGQDNAWGSNIAEHSKAWDSSSCLSRWMEPANMAKRILELSEE